VSTAFNQQQYDEAYPDGIDLHWWCLARSAVLASVLERSGLRNARMLEVGAGRGVVVKALREKGYDCDGVELAAAAPVPGVESFFFSDIAAADLPASQREDYQAILLLDVIEHIEDVVPFLQSLRAAFPAVTKFVIAVPASQSLWSNHDEFYGHFRRYDLDMLQAIADALGGRVESTTRSFFAYFTRPFGCC